MTDVTATRFVVWTERVYRPLLQKYRLQSEPDPAFMRLFCILDLLYASEFDQDTPLVDDSSLEHLSPFFASFPRRLNSLPSANYNSTGLTDALLNILARLVRLS